MKYLVFIIQGYQLQTEQGQLIDSTSIELIDKSYENALKRAKKIIDKKYYRLHSVIERFEDK